MSNWRTRLAETLEPLLSQPDPRKSAFSAYHDMPYAIFQYPPDSELELRAEIGMLKTRLQQKGKCVHVISMADVVLDLTENEMPVGMLAEAERTTGVEQLIDQFHSYLDRIAPLADAVLARLPTDLQPEHDIVFFTRVGFLFPIYRASTLVEQFHGKLLIPSVLFFPGSRDGPAGLCFMDVFPAEHNYRPRIF